MFAESMNSFRELSGWPGPGRDSVVRSFSCLILILWGALAAGAAAAAPAQDAYLTVSGSGGVPLQVVTAGDPANPPILLIHGIGQSHFMFYRQFQSRLTEDFFLVAFDLRGHGASGKPWALADYGSSAVWAGDVRAVLDALDIERPLIVAWSFGTLVAMDYLREYGPESVRGLLLTGSLGALLPFRMPDTDDTEAAEFAAVRALQLSENPRDRSEAGQRGVDWLVSDPLPPEDREVILAYTYMFPAYARRAIFARAFGNTDLRGLLDRLPVHIAIGSEDNPLMAEDAEVLAREHAGVSLSVYEDAGHSVFYERPERFNRELRQLFARATASAAHRHKEP